MPGYYFVELEENQSSLIKEIRYDRELDALCVFLRNHKPEHTVKTYINVPREIYFDFINANSIGKFYLTNIKHKFKTMSDEKQKIPTRNKASDKPRKIEISIDVTKIIKEWLVTGKTGTFMNLRFKLMPDGTVDQFGHLGYISQKPPKSVQLEQDKLPEKEKTRWPILGNGVEFEPTNGGDSVADLQDAAALTEPIDDLPF